MALLAKHGGLYSFLDPAVVQTRLTALMADGTPETQERISRIAAAAQAVATSYFYKLVPEQPYAITAEIMSFLTEPGRTNGVMYDTGEQPNMDIPAVFTFVGQFVDHDLTFNPMNLDMAEGDTVMDAASPIIDLDNVYGPRTFPTTVHPSLFDDEGRFCLRPFPCPHAFDGTAYDVCRDETDAAFIFDPRNDENQLVLQVHLLIMRLHNAIIDNTPLLNQLLDRAGNPEGVQARIEVVRREVVATWQSVLLNDYLPKIVDPVVLRWVIEQVHLPLHGALKHKPRTYTDPVSGNTVTAVKMPHEFAIAFRMGHSMLRPAYELYADAIVVLFKDAQISSKIVVYDEKGRPHDVSGADDLRGGRSLTCEHALDWDVFYPKEPDPEHSSMLIDHRITARVFNLPTSAIPDQFPFISNLAHRNLLRSTEIGITSGEELAQFYCIDPLTPEQVLEGHDTEAVRCLFTADGGEFKTPLWYYILKEAELMSAGGHRLGSLGSRLMAEVIVGAIFYANEYAFKGTWASAITGENVVMLRDILQYVRDHPAADDFRGCPDPPAGS
jgi:hypothetical protein